MTRLSLDLVGPFVRRPVAVLLISFGLLIFGIASWILIPVASLPEVEYPVISVETRYPGASAETMATAVAAPLERRLAAVAGVVDTNSTSIAGYCSVTLRFALERNIDAAASDVQAAINQASGDLPRDLPSPPASYKQNPADRSIMVLAFTSSVMPMSKVYRYAENVVIRRIGSLPGVASATAANPQKYAVRIAFDPAALASRGLSPEDLRYAIQRASVNRPKGNLEGIDSATTLTANDQLFDAVSFGKVVVAYRNGAPIRLSDVASIEDGVENDKSAGWYNGKPAIIVSIRKRFGANVITTIDGIIHSLAQLQSSLPPAIKLQVVTERAETIRASLRDVEWTLAVTIALVILVIFLFLRNARATVIPAATIPLSLLVTLAVLYICGFTLNNLSLMALTISVGFVVDDAIVVVENIVRHLEVGEAAEQAAIRGGGQVAFTILSITVSLVAVFIPVFFMGGVVGRLFREFGIAVSVAIFASALISLTLSPMMCRHLLRPSEPVEKAHSHRLATVLAAAYNILFRGYCTSLHWALRHRSLMLLGFAATLALTIGLYRAMPKGFFPTQDNGRMFAQAQAAAPGAPFAETRTLIESATRLVMTDPDVYSVTSFVGDGPDSVGLVINLKPRNERKADIYSVMARLRNKAKSLVGLQIFFQPQQEISTGIRTAHNEYLYTLIDSDRAELEHWAPIIESKLKGVSGLVDVSLNRQEGAPTAQVVVDRDMASRLHVDPQVIDETLYDTFGSRRVSEIYTDSDQYYTILGASMAFQADSSALKSIYVANADNQQVPLSSFAHIETGTGSTAITHRGQFASETISFGLEKSVSIGGAIERIRAMQTALSPPPGLQASFEGAAQEFEDSLASETWLLGAATLIIYIVLGILYESAIHPLTILSSLPSAGVGALLALMLTGSNLDVIGLIGIVLLIGIVKKNAIMMVDFAIQAERDGKAPEDAILEACLIRFRPIMMTSVAAICGGLPLAFGGGAGAELRHPLGISIVGGLLVSQVLTLYSTPVVHLMLRRLSRGSHRKGVLVS